EDDDDDNNKLDSTYLQNNDSEEVHIESKLIDDIEQQN
ncbi:unnamed protein product, partial [Rotaria magnacalcarata]